MIIIIIIINNFRKTTKVKYELIKELTKSKHIHIFSINIYEQQISFLLKLFVNFQSLQNTLIIQFL